VARRDAVAGHEDEETAEDAIDGDGRVEAFRRAKKLGGDAAGAGVGVLLAEMVEAERGVLCARKGAAATVGGGVLAAVPRPACVGLVSGITLQFMHGTPP
jgi:hypothetical protein